MTRRSIIANLSDLSRDDISILSSLTKDEHRSTNGIITKEEMISTLKSEGTKKVESAIERSIVYEELENSLSDLCIAKRIIVSNLVCPDDMVNTVLEFTLGKFNMDSGIKTKILDEVKAHMIEHYAFEERQYEIVEKALFDKGAFCQAVIPNEVYIMTSKTMPQEGYAFESDTGRRNINLAKTSKVRHQFDKYNKTTNVTFTSDLSLLRKKDKGMSLKLEDDMVVDEKDKELEKLVEAFLKRNNTSGYEELKELTTVEATEGIPLILDLPYESIIPVCDPATPELHYGYFVMLDREGNPLNKHSMRFTNNSNLQGYVFGAKELDPYTSNTSLGSSPVKKDTHEPLSYETFKNTIEAATNTAIKELLQDKDMDDYNKNLIMRTMFARTLANKETQILYIPEPMLTYYAFEYGEDGIGKSVYTGISELLAMKKYLIVVSYLGYLDEMIPNTNLDIDLSGVPSNNIAKYVDEAVQIALSSKINPFANLAESPYDITNLVRRHGITVNLSSDDMGGALPKATQEVRNREMPEVNEELFKIVDNMIYNKLGILASVVQDGYENEYAILVSGKQKIIAKINAARVEIHNKNMTDHVRKVIHNDGRIKSKLRALIADNLTSIINGFNADQTIKTVLLDNEKKDEVIAILLKKVILNISVQIPQPQSETDQTQVERVKNYTDALEDVLDAIIGSDAYPAEIFGEKASEKMEAVKGAVKAKLVLDMIKNTPYFQNVSNMIGNLLSDSENDEVTRMIGSMQDIIGKKLVSSYNTIQTKSNKLDETIENMQGDGDGGGSDYGSDSGDDSDDDSGGDSGGDDFGGGFGDDDGGMEIDDFGGDGGGEDFDFGGDEGGEEGSEDGDDDSNPDDGGEDDGQEDEPEEDPKEDDNDESNE